MIALAWLMLCIWPIVGVILYNKLNLPLAFCVTILGGYLLLPESLGVDLPILPELNKDTIPPLTAFVLTALKLQQNSHRVTVLEGWMPREPVSFLLVGMLVLGVFGTVFTNRDPLIYGPVYLPGLRPYDGFSFALEALMLLVPFLVARRILATQEAQRSLLIVLAVSAIIYTLPALWEIRMSPMLHVQIYGYFTGSFFQQIRAGGFRPTVFVGHGLALSIFLCLAVLAAAGLSRQSEGLMRKKWALTTICLFVALVLSKSFGAVLIALILLPAVLFLSPRTQLLVATCVAGIVLTFPMLRAADVVPVERVMAIVESVNPDRARSLRVRLDNEESLLEKARERPLFGWGGYSRNRIFDELGRNRSITDGAWILEMGTGGWVRYIALFGLLSWSIIGLFVSKRDKIDPVCAILALILCGKLIDLVPNTGFVPYIWMIAGSLLGRLEIKVAELREKGASTEASEAKAPEQYARDFNFPSPAHQVMSENAEKSGASYTRIKRKTPAYRR